MLLNDYTKPKNGAKFKGIGVARISGDNQDEKSWEDQEAFYRGWLDRTYGRDNFELRVIEYRGSGQILDHAEFLELCDLVKTGSYDFVIAEDLSRIIRRLQAVIFCEEAEALGTRVVGIGDPVDTAIEGWEYAAVFTSLKNKAFCKDTARRIRRTLRNRFANGEIVMCLQYGYIKPHPGASDEEVQKDPEAVAIYEKWISMLEDGATYAEVARWLESENVPTGQYCTTEKWSGAMVKRLTYNPILKGERLRNKRMVDRGHNGRPKCIDAPPEELLVRMVPHLAFVEPDRWDRLIRQLDERNRKYQRSAERCNDPRAGIPKRQTRWPGQHLRCGVCGRLYVHGGHGRTERMMCNGAREYSCFNAMTVDAAEVAGAVASDICDLVRSLPSFDEMWAEEYEAQRREMMTNQNAELKRVKAELAKEKRSIAHWIDALGELGSSPSVLEKIRSAESKVQLLQDRVYQLEQASSESVALPSLEEIATVSNKTFENLVVEDQEFGRMMRSVVTEFFVLPYRLADGGHVKPKIVYRASLAPLVDHPDLELLQFERSVDLMEEPRRLRHLDEVVSKVGAGVKHADVADELGILKTEVGHAMRLHRAMKRLGVDAPWVPVTTPSQAVESFKRVSNCQFDFKPLEGFETTRHPKAT